MQQHPEFGDSRLEWKITDVVGGTMVDLPASFFTIAAQLDHEPDLDQLSKLVVTNNFEPTDLTG
jgi:hypothetical protein